MNRSKTWLAVGVAAFLASGALAWSLYERPDRGGEKAVRLTSNAGTAQGLGQDKAAESNSAPSTSLTKKGTQTISRGALVDELVSTRKPSDAFAAFEILNSCLRARAYAVEVAQETDPHYKEVFTKFPKAEEVCTGLSPGQLTMRTRLLILAGEAGVPGSYQAATLFRSTNPESADDPEFVSALPLIVTAAVEAGDAQAILGRHSAYNSCRNPPSCSDRDPEMALAMYTAGRIILKGERQESGVPDTVTPALSQELGPDRASKAITKGKEIAFKTRGMQ